MAAATAHRGHPTCHSHCLARRRKKFSAKSNYQADAPRTNTLPETIPITQARSLCRQFRRQSEITLCTPKKPASYCSCGAIAIFHANQARVRYGWGEALRGVTARYVCTIFYVLTLVCCSEHWRRPAYVRTSAGDTGWWSGMRRPRVAARHRYSRAASGIMLSGTTTGA